VFLSLMPWDFWLIFFVLGVVIPWRGRLRLQHLLALPVVDTKQKLALYGTTMAFQWMLMGVVAWRAFARGLTTTDFGLARPVGLNLVGWSLVGTILLGAFQWCNLRRLGSLTGTIPDFMRKLADRVLPKGMVEFVPYCALAVTAGVCEEFLYRGFVMGALTRAGLYPSGVVIISSVFFGLAHTYQGRSGVVGTTLMGFAFGVARYVLQSLVPVMAWHSAVDIAAGIAGPRYLLASTK
jgi:CAAX protease family protein